MMTAGYERRKIRGARGPALFCALLLAAAAAHANAFKFFGLGSEGRAPAILGRMEADFGGGDCAAVSADGDELFREKPSAGTRRRAYELMGQCYESQGLPDRAIGVYKLGLGLYPEYLFFSARLAAIYLKAGFYSTAAPLFRDVAAGRYDDIEADAGLGKCYAEMGFLTRAKDHYARAVILGDFRDMKLMKEYAWWMIKKRDWGEAEFIISKALELDAKDAGLYAALSRIASGKGDYKAAEKRMEEALEREPGNRGFALERALVLLMSGDADGAAGAAARFLKDGAQDPFASLIKGMALYEKGRLAEARSALAAAGKDESGFVARLAGSLLADMDARLNGK